MRMAGDFQANAPSLVAFGLSALLHLSIAIILALIVRAHQGLGTEQAGFIASTTETVLLPSEIAEIELQEQLPEEPENSPPEVNIASIASNDVSSSLDVAAAYVPFTPGTQQEIGRAIATTKGLLNESDTRIPYPARASFFGAYAEGNRFVFVVDSSGSMRGPRWTALVYELIRAIESLSPDQEFFVLSFDVVPHPMFGEPPPIGKFLRPSQRNIFRLQRWLQSLELGHGTKPAEAVGIAIQLKPDAIFLLSDGEIQDNTIFELRLWNRKTDEIGDSKALVPIHTILLHSTIGFATLQTIANENAGSFTPVPLR